MKKIVASSLFVAALLFASSSVNAQSKSGSNAFDTYSTLNGLSGESLASAQQPAPWCYVPGVGRFPMTIALPAGVPCTVYSPYYPYAAMYVGTTGF